jgi:hypothetical protein
MNPVDAVVAKLSGPHACENVDFVTQPVQGLRKAGDMRSKTTYGDRVQGFPGKDRDAQSIGLPIAGEPTISAYFALHL